VRVNRLPVKTVAEFTSIVDKFKKGDAVVLHVARYNPENKKIVTRIVQFTFQ
jgi:PDZ domain-containing secreted protein